MNLMAFDPGKITGWASFENTSLSHAGVVKNATFAEPVEFWPVEDWPLVVVIEMPRWYPQEREIDVNDLLDLSRLVGRIEGFFAKEGSRIEIVYPRSWKGTVPKKIHNARVLAALTKEEIALLPRRPRAKDHDHNVLDAVGIGLWKLGRM